jgi:HSP20 family protein
MHIERFRGRHPVYFRPSLGLRGFRGDMDRFFSDVLDEGVREELVAFNPSVDLVDTRDYLQVKVELPGVKKGDVEISLKEDLLTIKGEKKEEREEKGENRYYVESTYGTFSRRLTLPSLVKTEMVKATFEDGVLVITLPKAEEEKATEVKVEVK